ncbi:hypothetical protein PG989_010825 [Apiospora arundinis]
MHVPKRRDPEPTSPNYIPLKYLKLLLRTTSERALFALLVAGLLHFQGHKLDLGTPQKAVVDVKSGVPGVNIRRLLVEARALLALVHNDGVNVVVLDDFRRLVDTQVVLDDILERLQVPGVLELVLQDLVVGFGDLDLGVDRHLGVLELVRLLGVVDVPELRLGLRLALVAARVVPHRGALAGGEDDAEALVEPLGADRLLVLLGEVGKTGPVL